MSWWSQAACLKVDPELFFPVGTHGPAVLQIEEAKRVCRICFARADCLESALADGPDHRRRVRTHPDERRQLKRRRVRAS